MNEALADALNHLINLMEQAKSKSCRGRHNDLIERGEQAVKRALDSGYIRTVPGTPYVAAILTNAGRPMPGDSL